MNRKLVLSLGLAAALVSGIVIRSTISARSEKTPAFEARSSSYGGKERSDAVADMYAELVDKDKGLLQLEDHITKVKDAKGNAIAPFLDFNQRNEYYYNTANSYTDRIGDAELRKRVKELLAASQGAYKTATAQHQNLLKAIDERMVTIGDMHTAVKVLQTMRAIEQYQHKELPSSAALQQQLNDEHGVVKHLDSFVKK